MSVQMHEGIYQIHWCIHGRAFAMPLSLTDKAPVETASQIVEKLLKAETDDEKLKALFEERMALSTALSWEK